MRRILALALFLFPLSLAGQVINAATCSAADVQTACNSLTSGTITLNIPACGGAAWTSQVTCTQPSGGSNLTIHGTTTCTGDHNSSVSCTDGTVIIDNFASSSNMLILNTATDCAKFRVTGITFKGGSGSVKDPVINVHGLCQSVRVDHNHLNMAAYTLSGFQQFRFTGSEGGVADHNLFDDNNGALIYTGFDVWNDAFGGTHDGDGSWSAATNLGSAPNYVYFEDNQINGGVYVNDCLAGGRDVVRFNIINYSNLQTHPLAGGNRNRGCRAQEIYKNNFHGNPICDGSGGYPNCNTNLYWLSGGTGVLWGNSIPIVAAPTGSGWSWLVSAHSMRANSSTYPQNPTPAGWGYCGTQSGLAGDGSLWDGAPGTPTGYPCLDDPGRGQEARGPLNGHDFNPPDSTGVLNTQTGTIAYTNQALEPFYEWLDGDSSGVFTPVPMNAGGALTISDGVLTQNTDLYIYNPSFTGATGVGSGVFASRPGTCTTGVAYWAIDQGSWNLSGSGGQGVLYKCTSTNTWTAFYTPYTYPHPLITGGGGAAGTNSSFGLGIL